MIACYNFSSKTSPGSRRFWNKGGERIVINIAQTAVVGCIDPRIQKLLAQFRKEHGLNGGTSTPHHLPGPSLNIGRELDRLDLAVNHLGVNEIFLLDHVEPECAGFAQKYGTGYDPFMHVLHLREARETLTSRYPEVKIHIYVMWIPDNIVEVR
ncbi:hypothetical protein IID23_02155 [Patescibacteria group bacterium]|nr:hypothetical protein [Patescibacteria group bacterium]